MEKVDKEEFLAESTHTHEVCDDPKVVKPYIQLKTHFSHQIVWLTSMIRMYNTSPQEAEHSGRVKCQTQCMSARP